MTFLVAGKANGEVLKLDEPLSFWGGVDPQTGEITDLRLSLIHISEPTIQEAIA